MTTRDLCMTMRLQHAAQVEGREVLVLLDTDHRPTRRFLAVFEDGRDRVQAESILSLVDQLRALSVQPNQLRVEIDGDCALPDVARDELFDQLVGDEIPKFL